MNNLFFEQDYYNKYLFKDSRTPEIDYIYKFGELYIYKDSVQIFNIKIKFITMLIILILLFILFDKYEDIILIVIVILFFLI